MKNYYQILNVRPTATEADIKRSYRVLAKRYHPDVNPGDSAAADKFADINEANAVLSDPKARAEYDQKLAESTAPRLNPEDIIARQRAQAQAAARQAAYRNNNMNNASRRDAAAAAAAARMRQAQAQAQAAARQAAGGNYQNAQFQAQVQAMREQAFRSGREQGMADAKSLAEAEIARINANLRTVTDENKRLKKQVEDMDRLKHQVLDAERDRRELEQELFNRDRELSQEQLRAREIEEQLNAFRAAEETNDKALDETKAELDEVKAENDKLKAESEALRSTVDKARACIEKLEKEKKALEEALNQSELKNKAQIQLQQDKRRQMQEEIDELNRQLGALSSEVDDLRTENDQWQQYAKSEQFLSDAERRIDEWNKKLQADRRLAKPTLYGTLGVLIWATDEEIADAYTKLKKRYSGKTDESMVSKLGKVEEAYAVLSDSARRADYNLSIEITEERVEEERKLIAENESLMEEYRNQLAGKEFWARYDEITAAALAGDANSQYALGEMLYYGDEVDRDLEQAVFWFKEGAKQKHPDAMYLLGLCFINGEGVEQNKTTGEGFIRQAAKLGSKLAKQYVDLEAKKATNAANAAKRASNKKQS